MGHDHLYKPTLAYHDVVMQLIELLPLNQKLRAPNHWLAEALKCSESAVNICRPLLMSIGAVELSYGGNPDGGGKTTYLERKMEGGDILARLKDLGLDHRIPDDWTRSRIERAASMATKSAEPPPRVPDSPFEVLKPLLKDEPKALIEAARQYMERQGFIDDKIEEFKRHGLTLDLAAIGAPKDERLEHIGLVLPYVTALERANEKLSKVTGNGADKLRAETLEASVADLKRRIEEIRRERQAEQEEHRRALLSRDNRIRDLEGQVAAFKRQQVFKS